MQWDSSGFKSKYYKCLMFWTEAKPLRYWQGCSPKGSYSETQWNSDVWVLLLACAQADLEFSTSPCLVYRASWWEEGSRIDRFLALHLVDIWDGNSQGKQNIFWPGLRQILPQTDWCNWCYVH